MDVINNYDYEREAQETKSKYLKENFTFFVKIYLTASKIVRIQNRYDISVLFGLVA